MFRSVMLVIFSSYILSMCSKKKKKEKKDPIQAVPPSVSASPQAHPSQKSQKSKAPLVAPAVIPAMATALVATDQVKAGDEKKEKSSASAADAPSKNKEAKEEKKEKEKEKDKDKMEDSFDNLKPKQAEAYRAKDIRDEKVPNKGDYKTFLPTSDFDNSIVDTQNKK